MHRRRPRRRGPGAALIGAQDLPALDQIVAEDPGARQQAWQRLLVAARREDLRALLPRINTLLEGAGDNAFAEAVERLRDLGLWGWELQPETLVLRELESAALSADDGRHELAVRSLADCPLALGAEVVLPLVDMLIIQLPGVPSPSSLSVLEPAYGRSRVRSIL